MFSLGCFLTWFLFGALERAANHNVRLANLFYLLAIISFILGALSFLWSLFPWN